MGKYTIIYETGGVRYKICKIWFGSDGSYYVTSPYHPAEKAFLFKATVNYALVDIEIRFSEFVELGHIEDDDHQLKLSHHPDGFIQFSGQGIVSGIDEQGQIRGMGIKSWPLTEPVRGPAFAVALQGIEHFQVVEKISKGDCLFTEQEIVLMPTTDSLMFVLEGYYFPASWRRFVRLEPDGTHSIRISHPGGAILPLKVLFPPKRSSIQGFLGMELYTEVNDPGSPTPCFRMSSSTGNIRHNEQGERLGDGLFCFYPREFNPIGKDLNYTPDSDTTDSNA